MGAHAERMERLAQLQEIMAGLTGGQPAPVDGGLPVLDDRTLFAIRDGLKRIERGTR